MQSERVKAQDMTPVTAEYRVGDEVRWFNHGGGFAKEKHGTVVAIVPASEPASAYVPEGMKISSNTVTGARLEQNYLVLVGARKRRLFRPLNSQLELVKRADDQKAAARG